MKKLHLLLIVGSLFATSANAQPIPRSFADLAEKLSPTVVNISTTQHVKSGGVQMFFPFGEMQNAPGMEHFKDFFEQFNQLQSEPTEREVTSLGSGFVIDADGYIITNYHVISKAEEIKVRFSDNHILPATIIGKDKLTDLALLKVDPKSPLPFVKLGDSDAARVGDWVVAIGNPFGLGGTVTAGIISARQRSINAGPFDDFIQTDAAINQGNSGGPLFNMDGEVVGINSAIFSPTGGNVGIGFAIPAALAKPVIDQLKAGGKVTRGWLGVKIQAVDEEIANSIGLPKGHGALVVEISPDSPAAKSALEAGDVITHYNGTEITEMRFLPRMVAESKIGSKATMTVWHKGKSQRLSVTIARLETGEDEETDGAATPEEEKESGSETVIGLQLTTLTKDVKQHYNINAKLTGVLVLNVEASGEAAKRGIKRGDVITEVNNEEIRDIAHFKRLIGDAKKAGRNFALLRVVRGDGAAFVTLPVK